MTPDQPQHGKDAGYHQHQHAGTQHARRVAIQCELPPELIGVLDMAMHENPEPERHHQHQHNTEHPAGIETLIQQSAATVKLGA